jgi:hypothetical protein
MLNALTNVRFEGNNGHDADVTRCLLMTHSGHAQSPHLDKEKVSQRELCPLWACALLVNSLVVSLWLAAAFAQSR